MDFNFTMGNKDFTAVDAGWSQNGCAVWDIENVVGEFVDSVTVHPYSNINDTIVKWMETEACYA